MPKAGLAKSCNPLTNIGALRDDGAITDLDLAQGVENHLVPDVAMIAGLKLPGIRDAHRRPEEYALADAGAEQPEEPSAPAVERLGRQPEESGLNDPQQLGGYRGAHLKTGSAPGIHPSAGIGDRFSERLSLPRNGRANLVGNIEGPGTVPEV